MKRILFILICFSALQGKAQLFPNLGGQRTGVSAYTFLKSDISPVSSGIAGASVAMEGNGYSVFHNPAAVGDIKDLTISASNLFLPADINQSFLSGLIPLKNNSSTLGISVNNLSSGAMETRTEFQPDGTGQYFYVSDLSAGLTYSRQLSEMFSMGITGKYVREQIAEYHVNTAAADLGFLYKTDFKALKFAVMIQNFGGNSSLKGTFIPVKYNRDTTVTTDKFGMPTVFKMGASLVPYKTDKQALLASIQLDHPNDNAENIRIGVEYNYLKLVFLRAGYKINVEGQTYPSFGFGYRARIGHSYINIDYGMNPAQYLGVQHCVGLSYSINKNKSQEVKTNE